MSRTGLLPPDKDHEGIRVGGWFGGPLGCCSTAVATGARPDGASQAGSITSEHLRRNTLLSSIAKAPLGLGGEFETAFFILTNSPLTLPIGVAMHDHGPLFGRPMYETLSSSRIVINIPAELADDQAPNMRLFEATGVGSFLLTEKQSTIEVFFRSGEEIETFSDEKELIEKIYYYLAHPEKCQAIAANGQARCLRDYSQHVRARSNVCFRDFSQRKLH